MEIGNVIGNKKCTNRQWSVFTDSRVVHFVITLVFYLVLVIWLVSCALLLLLHFVITYSVWLTSTYAASNVAIQSGSHEFWAWDRSCNLTMGVISLGLGTRLAFLLFPRHFQFWSFAVYEANNVFIPVDTSAWYDSIWSQPLHAAPSICSYRNTWQQRPGNKARVTKQVIKNWRWGELWDA